MRDAVIIGSGFGGTMAAHELVAAGLDVLMLERGDWVTRGPHNWDDTGSVDLTPFYSHEAPYRVAAGGNGPSLGSYSCVGGPSVFYGGVSIRFREDDFVSDPDIVGNSGAAWPYDYAELEPWYGRAESLLGVAGASDEDPTEPRRSTPYPHEPGALSDTSARIAHTARDLGLSPFRLPLAINYSTREGRNACVACTTCDTFACAIEAKNDLATTMLPALVANGLEVRANTVVTNLVARDGRIEGVECYDKRSGRREHVRARTVLVAAGALGTPHLLLSSQLDAANPAGHLVGRHLMRHCNAIVFGVFPDRPNPRRQFHKQIGIHDFYFGHADVRDPLGKLGSIQQLATPPAGLVREELPRPLGPFVGPAVDHLTGLLVMAEDQPQPGNHVRVDWETRDTYGLPELTIEHHYTARDTRARAALVQQSKRILRRAGAPVSYVHQIKTFSHAVGTVRFGADPETSVLDEECRFRGVDNLHVVDASFMPTSAGLNPSLTISANALRVGAAIAARMNLAVALVVGLAAGLHAATWGMFKDAPYEGFTWQTYLRSPVIAAVIAVVVAAAGDFPSTNAAGIAVLFGLTYVIERGINEFYKTFLREEDQSKYSIPMQLSVRGKVVTKRRTRLLAGLGYAVGVLVVVLVIDAIGDQGAGGLAVVLIVGSLGGWISAFGGAWKDAPVEGFQPFKFVRSPLVALGYALLLAALTTDPVYAAFGALGYTVATLETYKTFFKPNTPRGKFAGKEIQHPEWLERRYRFVPLYVAIWVGIVVVFVVALAEPHSGLI